MELGSYQRIKPCQLSFGKWSNGSSMVWWNRKNLASKNTTTLNTWTASDVMHEAGVGWSLVHGPFIRKEVSSILGLLYKPGKLTMMSHTALVQGEWNGGSHPEFCVIRMCHQNLNASFTKRWLDGYVVWSEMLQVQRMKLWKWRCLIDVWAY